MPNQSGLCGLCRRPLFDHRASLEITPFAAFQITVYHGPAAFRQNTTELYSRRWDAYDRLYELCAGFNAAASFPNDQTGRLPGHYRTHRPRGYTIQPPDPAGHPPERTAQARAILDGPPAVFNTEEELDWVRGRIADMYQCELPPSQPARDTGLSLFGIRVLADQLLPVDTAVLTHSDGTIIQSVRGDSANDCALTLEVLQNALRRLREDHALTPEQISLHPEMANRLVRLYTDRPAGPIPGSAAASRRPNPTTDNPGSDDPLESQAG
jgi:hypothetical protein